MTDPIFVGAGYPAAADSPNGSSRRRFAYDAISSDGKRQSAPTVSYSEDYELRGRRRDRLSATTRDVVRNFSIATWIVRRHLDYCTSFRFQARTGNDLVDERIEAIVEERSQREWCDARKRHSLRRLIRLAEGRRIIDGDVGVQRILGPDWIRGSVQLIEEDRIRNPLRPDNPDAWISGVRVNRYGQSMAYGVWSRSATGASLEWEAEVPAQKMYLHAYHDHTHRIDQVRGISPMVAAVNTLRDVYEGFNFALMRTKLAQMFGLKITRIQDSTTGGYGSAATTDSDSDGTADSDYTVDLNKGPFQLDMDPGDDAEFLESKTPAQETVAFLQLMAYVACKSLDIPITIFDESQANWSSARVGFTHYIRSTETKIADVQDLLNWLTRWWVALWVADGVLVLPRSVRFEDLRWEWVPAGVPWYDPAKEIAGAVNAIAAGLDNPVRLARAFGTDVYENIDKLSEAITYAKSKGINLSYDKPVEATPTEQPMPEEDRP